MLVYSSLGCISDYYGENCSRKCGYCLDNETCHHINGNCEQGCNPGYIAPLCSKGNHYYSLLRLTSSMQHIWKRMLCLKKSYRLAIASHELFVIK